MDLTLILKDCPSGMKLDSPVYNNLYFDKINSFNDSYPIICYTVGLTKTEVFLTKRGFLNNHVNAKCVIFPKGKTTWEDFKPPLKVGDIITTKESITGAIQAVHPNLYSIIVDNQIEIEVFHEDCQLATTEEEKEWMNYLKKIGYIWDKEKNILKPSPEDLPIFIIGDRIQFENGTVAKIKNISNDTYIFDNIKPMEINYVNKHCKLKLFSISDLKPFDKVIVRDVDLDEDWCADFFSHYKNNKYIGLGNCVYNQCVPYNKETKYLIGTSQEYEGYYKTWEDERSQIFKTRR